MQTPPSGIGGPRCKGHGKASMQRNVTKGKNAGRPAWMCSLGLPNGCGFVAWADDGGGGSGSPLRSPGTGSARQGADGGGGDSSARRQLNFGGRMTPSGNPGAAAQYGNGGDGSSGGAGALSPNGGQQQTPQRALPASLRGAAAGGAQHSQEYSPQGTPPGACFSCGQPGHWANNCPNKDSSTPSKGGGRALPASLASPTRQGGSVPPAGTLQIQLLGGGRAAAKTAFNQAFIDLLKALPEVQGELHWNPKGRVWEFPVAAVPALAAAVRDNLLGLEVQQPPKFVMKLFTQHAEAAPDEVERRLGGIPPDIWQRLFPFQREGVRRGVSHSGRCLLGDDMGLGKTVQAICVAACFAEDWPLLVVCPSALRLQWADALLSWAPPAALPPPEHIAVVAAAKDIDKKLTPSWRRQRKRILIVSYDLVKKLPDDVAAQFGVIIADESHALKSPAAQRTQAVAPLVKAARRAILITGTPALSRPIELYPQLDMLTNGQLGALSTFGKRYCAPTPSPYGYGTEYKGSANEAELHAVLEVVGMIRRLKQDVLADLPPKRRMRVPILPDPARSRDLEAVKRAMRDVNEDGALRADEADRRRQQLLNQFYGVSGDAKAKPAAEHITDLLDKGAKLLVFAHHTAVLDAIEGACLGKAGDRRGVRIDGSTAPAARQAAVHEFQTNAHCRVALLSITAAGVGITLTAAEVVVFAELVWTPAQLIQAEDRAHRLGQLGSLEVHYLHAPGSIDDIMWPNVRAKLDVVGSTLDGNLTGTATGLDIGQFRSWAPPPEPEGSTQVAAGGPSPAAMSRSTAGTPSRSQQHELGAPQLQETPPGSQWPPQHSQSQPALQLSSLGSQPPGSQPWSSPGGSSRPAALSDIDLTPVDSIDEVCPGDGVEPGGVGSEVARARRPRSCGGDGSLPSKDGISIQQQQNGAQLSQIDLTPVEDSDDDVRPGDSWVPEAGSGGAGANDGSQQQPASQQSARTAVNEAAAVCVADDQGEAAPASHSGTGDRVGQKRRRKPSEADVIDLT